ncbi:MAG TPA: M4 family metallopeptidase [Vicinamibacteria bacterium]
MRITPRVVVLLAGGLAGAGTLAGARAAAPGARSVEAVGARELVEWDRRVAAMSAAGELAPRWERADTLVPGRRHVRLAQVHRGVRVEGGELAVQTAGPDTVSVFGTLYEGLDVDTTPAVGADRAVAIVEGRAGVDIGPGREPALRVLPLATGGYALAWRLRAATGAGVRLYYVGARDGRVILERDDSHTQSAVGLGTGVLGDTKKMSVRPGAGGFVAEDRLRPPPLRALDMRGDLFRTLRFLNGALGDAGEDLARDDDNTWTDGAAVDAHTYAGWTYDYFYKRFGRRGLDNQDLPIVTVVHPVRREDLSTYPDDVVSFFFLNAFYAGDGILVLGEGLPPGRRAGGNQWNYFAAGFDVVAHEITHGVTEYTSNLVYEGESGALNEAFSDVMAAGAEFLFQPPGSGPLQADYLVAEDVATPRALRSMQNPTAHGQPDHYSIRFTGVEDNGGVHINSGIVNHAFYLAVEGGTHRLSGRSVPGVGAANREQVERVFYRAFTQMLPPRATFALARAATRQAARDLYGEGSAPERAVAEGWSAVGVE